MLNINDLSLILLKTTLEKNQIRIFNIKVINSKILLGTNFGVKKKLF